MRANESVNLASATGALCVILSLRCAGAPEAVDLGQLAAAVVGGEPSPETQNAVVLLNQTPEGVCTGSVVSPTLILTARHCMYDYLAHQVERLCGDEGGARPVLGRRPLDRWLVQTGNAKPLDDTGAHVVAVHSNERLDTCDTDLALVEIDRPLDIVPLQLRLDAPPQVGEWGTLVGWGATSEDVGEESWLIPDQRQQRQIRIEAVSPGLYGPPEGTVRPLDPTSFVGTEGGCTGDSGGPLISNATGAIVGVLYDMRAAILTAESSPLARCINGTSGFQRLDLQQEWIRETFWSRGAMPWLEGHARPATTGAACSAAEDCNSGLCVSAGSSRFCAVYCDAGQCPEGFECIERDAGQAVCSLRQIEARDAASGATCTLRVGRGCHWPLGVAMLAMLRARRGRTGCKPSSSSSA